MMPIDMQTFERIDHLFDPDTPTETLVEALDNEQWQVVQAACNALGERRDRSAVPVLARVLNHQDELPIYGGPENHSLEEAPNEKMEEILRCRFRVKQAACHALGAIGEEYGVDAVDNDVVDHLARYATDEDEDYVVRAAACQSLGKIGAERAQDALKVAAEDGEWCTRTEARKALNILG